MPAADLGNASCEAHLNANMNVNGNVNPLLLVAAYEKQFELTQTRPGHEESVNITCRAQGIFPEPKMALLRGGHEDR